uniref:Peptidase S1 domain-containing protein n=1 Tax=Dendroctonus ponderosae TaxID=77166 RepID=A0AAR5QKG5_DENPD
MASIKVKILAILCFIQFCQSKNVPGFLSDPHKESDNRIVGGVAVNILNYPYQVSLQYLYHHICGGAIISNRWIASAAHCTQLDPGASPTQLFTIRMGTSFVQSEGTVLTVSRTIEHPGYGNSANFFDHDLSLIEVSRDIVFSNAIQPVALPVPHAPLIPRSRCVVSGWGRLSEGGSSPLVLHAVTVPLISIKSCNEYYQNSKSIISNRWVLTAAHCTQLFLAYTPPSLFTIRLGTSFVESEGERFTVNQVIEHPGYGNSAHFFDYDMCLIQVSREIVFSNSVQPVALPAPHAPLIPGSRCLVSGWGTLTEGGSSPSQLHAVEVPLISIESCNEYYQNGLGVTETMMCAGSPYGGRHACQGDSGGPLVVDNILIGIVSWGAGCARPNFPGVYANVPFVREWITEVAGI